MYPLLDFDDYFAEMAAAFQEFERLYRLGERKHPVDYWVNLVFLVETDHLLESILGAINDSLQRHRPTESQQVHIQTIIVSIHLARDVADAIDESPESDTIKALSDGLSTTNF